MSRIHEALKKAAQERATQLAAGVDEAAAVDISVEVQKPFAGQFGKVGGSAERQRVSVSPNENGPIHYEELIKKCAHPKWEIDSRLSVFRGGNAGGGGAERFRTLRSRLYQIAGAQTLKRLLITSSVPAEGKTFITSNLGQSIVQQAGRRVLLIDADLRAPRLHVALGAPRTPGLADYLKGGVSEYEVIQSGLQENLFLIPAGQEVSNPSELLLSEKMKQLLDRVTPTFDWVIIDSPPSLPVHDASILADLTDGVLLVIRAGSTESGMAEKVASEFRDKNLLGAVLNRADKAESYGEYYSGYSGDSSRAD